MFNTFMCYTCKMLRIQSLASGSRGNAIHISSLTTNILVDVGLSLPQLLKRMSDAGIDSDKINAVLITHEHDDHICGLARFMAKHKNTTKLYLHQDSKATLMQEVLRKNKTIDEANIITFSDDGLTIGDIHVEYFHVPHDSQFCFGYTFRVGDRKISLATDIGHCSDMVLQKMAGSQIVLLESNHCLEKLEQNVKYPLWLKRRIVGQKGHLSNNACGVASFKLWQLGVQQVILAHLSKENNSASIAYSTVSDFLARKGLQEGVDIFIDVATQDEIGNLFVVE